MVKRLLWPIPHPLKNAPVYVVRAEDYDALAARLAEAERGSAVFVNNLKDAERTLAEIANRECDDEDDCTATAERCLRRMRASTVEAANGP